MRLEPKVRAFLEAPRYAVLATVNPSGSPHLTEMWYELRGDEVIFNTTEERTKRRNLEHDPRVSLLVSAVRGEPTWRSLAYVRLDGVVRQVATGDAARQDIRGMGVRYDGPEEAERSWRESWSKQNRVTYAISLRRLYAKGL